MNLRLPLAIVLCSLAALLAACTSTPPQAVAETQADCRVRESRIGTNRLSKKCEPVTDEEKAQARQRAEGMREEARSVLQARPSGATP